MIIQIKVIDYTGKLNYDEINLLDISEIYNEDDMEKFWDKINSSKYKSSSEFLMRLLIGSIEKSIKDED